MFVKTGDGSARILLPPCMWTRANPVPRVTATVPKRWLGIAVRKKNANETV